VIASVSVAESETLARDEDQPSEIALVALLHSSASDAKQKC
jgi:hypothetical protein